MAGQSQRKTRVAYAIFEGGGAKGISHVGALRALEDLKIAIIGVAGASAGAIIAALVAVGYRADDLLDPDSREHLLARYRSGPIDLLGRSSWDHFQRLRSAGRPAVFLLFLATVLSIAVSVTGLPALAAYGAWAALLARLAFDLGPASWSLLGRRGLFSTEHICAIINRALLDKLQGRNLPLPPDGLVRFRDMPAPIPLKIIVSDVFGRQLRLFDVETTPNASVADAVAASAAIPFFFRPPRIRGMPNDLDDVYADGGLVSNLPAWAFERDKRRLERYRPELGSIPIYACELRAATPPAAARQGARGIAALLQHLFGTLETGIFGSQAIVQRFVSELTVLPVETTLATLSFDCPIGDALAAYDAGRKSVEARLRRAYDEEAATLALLEAYSAGAVERIDGGAWLPAGSRLRTYVVGKSDDRYQVVAGIRMELDADDRMVFDDECPLAPAAAKQRDGFCCSVRGLDAAALAMTKQEHALLRRDLHSLIAIPVFDASEAWNNMQAGLRPATSRVVCLDSDHDLAPVWKDRAMRDWLQNNSVLLSAEAIRTQVEELSRGPTDLQQH